MGNETSSKQLHFDEQAIEGYTREYKKMQETISTHNLTIKNLLAEKEKLAENVKKLEATMAKKEEDTKKRISDIKTNQKKVHSELSKYKSIPEFEEILSLYTELLEFRNKIETTLSNNGRYKTNKDEDEIERLKRNNMELSRQLTNIGGKSVLLETAGQFHAAESEVNAKREQMRLEASKNNFKLVRIQEKMKESTAKFAGTMSNAIGEARTQLQKSKREFSEVEAMNAKLDDNVPYAKVLNVLLQQQNTLMKEVILITGGAGPSNPPPQQVFNNLRPSPQKMQEKPMSFANLRDQDQDDNLSRYDSVDDLINFEDDVSECGSLSSENAKPFKLILHNIPDCGNDRLFVIEVLKNLTDLSLDDIVVRRIGKPGGSTRPIVVCFDKIGYIHQILKKKINLKDTAYSNIRINTFKFNKDQNAGGKGNHNPRRGDGGFGKGNNPNQQGKPQNKSNQNKGFPKRPNNPNNDAKQFQPKQNNTKSVFPF